MAYYLIRVDTKDNYKKEDIKKIIEESLDICDVDATVNVVQYQST